MLCYIINLASRAFGLPIAFAANNKRVAMAIGKPNALLADVAQ